VHQHAHRLTDHRTTLQRVVGAVELFGVSQCHGSMGREEHGRVRDLGMDCALIVE
jgi:hypothetical protein